MTSSMSGATGFRDQTGFDRRGGMTGEKIPRGYRKSRMSQFTPEQHELLSQLFAHVSPESFLSRLASGDQSMFEEMEAPAMRQFAGLQGNLASRFSGMGLGARQSSGFQNTMNQAASDFAQDLQSQRMQLRNQAIRDLMGMGGDLLSQRPYEQQLIPKKQDKTAELLGRFAGAIPGLIYAAKKGGGFMDAIKGGLSIFGGG